VPILENALLAEVFAIVVCCEIAGRLHDLNGVLRTTAKFQPQRPIATETKWAGRTGRITKNFENHAAVILSSRNSQPPPQR
jgi:hypothetical protein